MARIPRVQATAGPLRLWAKRVPLAGQKNN